MRSVTDMCLSFAHSCDTVSSREVATWSVDVLSFFYLPLRLCGYLIVPDTCISLLVDSDPRFYLLWLLHRVKVVLVHVHSPIFHVPCGDVDVLMCLKFKGDLLYCA